MGFHFSQISTVVERENCGCGVAERSGQINSLGRNLLDTAQTILSQKPMPRQNTMISAFTARNAIRWVCMHLSAMWIIITNEKLFSTPLNFHEHTLPLKKSLLWKLQWLNQCVWISEAGRYHFGYGELYSPFCVDISNFGGYPGDRRLSLLWIGFPLLCLPSFHTTV